MNKVQVIIFCLHFFFFTFQFFQVAMEEVVVEVMVEVDMEVDEFQTVGFPG